MDPFNGRITIFKEAEGGDEISKQDNSLKVYHHGDTDLRGCNIFTGKLLSDSDIAAVTSPLQLVKKNDPWTKTGDLEYTNAPGLYIVG